MPVLVSKCALKKALKVKFKLETNIQSIKFINLKSQDNKIT